MFSFYVRAVYNLIGMKTHWTVKAEFLSSLTDLKSRLYEWWLLLIGMKMDLTIWFCLNEWSHPIVFINIKCIFLRRTDAIWVISDRMSNIPVCIYRRRGHIELKSLPRMLWLLVENNCRNRWVFRGLNIGQWGVFQMSRHIKQYGWSIETNRL